MFSMYTVRSLHADTAEDTAAIDALVGAPDSKDLQISTLLSIVKGKKRVQNGGRNGVFSDGPMGATAPDGFGRKNPVHSWGARTTSSRFRLPAKWGELLGGE